MPSFIDPPVRQAFFKEQPSRENPDGLMDYGWQRYFVASTNRHSKPQIQIVSQPPTTAIATAANVGLMQSDGTFLYVVTAVGVIKKTLLSNL